MDTEQINRVERLIERSGIPISFLPSKINTKNAVSKQPSNNDLSNGTIENRVRFAKNRQEWEESFRSQTTTKQTTPLDVAKQQSIRKTTSDLLDVTTPKGKQQSQDDAEWNMMLALLQKYYRDNGDSNVPLNYAPQPKLAKWVDEQKRAYRGASKFSLTKKQVDALDALQFPWTDANNNDTFSNDDATIKNDEQTRLSLAAAKTALMVAKAGGGDVFTGESLGIGGLDDVLLQVKRRIWVPLAAPPSLLRELGINPVRGLLLYGMPGKNLSLFKNKQPLRNFVSVPPWLFFFFFFFLQICAASFRVWKDSSC